MDDYPALSHNDVAHDVRCASALPSKCALLKLNLQNELSCCTTVQNAVRHDHRPFIFFATIAICSHATTVANNAQRCRAHHVANATGAHFLAISLSLRSFAPSWPVVEAADLSTLPESVDGCCGIHVEPVGLSMGLRGRHTYVEAIEVDWTQRLLTILSFICAGEYGLQAVR